MHVRKILTRDDLSMSSAIYSPAFVRARTHDNMLSWDLAGGGGKRLDRMYNTHDGRTCDSTGSFYINELERMDQTLHEPLAAVTWGRDIMLREDVTIADEISSYTISSYAAASGLGTGVGVGGGKMWIGKDSTAIVGVALDIARTPHPLRLWGMEVKYTIPELESALRLGRPVDQQKYEGMQLQHQMDIDAQVYIGDINTGDTGLFNNATVAATNVLPGASGSTKWNQKSADEILADVNTGLTTTWAATGYAVIPSELRLPPAQFGYITTQKVSNAGNVSILKYVQENNLLTTSNGQKLNIQPVKWLIGAGAGGTIGTLNTVDRMVFYTNDKNRVRFPMTLLQRTPIQYESIWHKTTYFCRLGVVEWVYPETGGYFDGI